MKLLISLMFLSFYFQSKSQNSESIDTILKSNPNDYLISKGLKLYSNREMDFWRLYSEPLFSNPEFQIISSSSKNLKGIVNLKEQSILLPFEYNFIDNNKDSVLFTSKNNLKGIFFPFENKNIVANNKKVTYIRKNKSFLTLRNDSLIHYNKLGQVKNIFSEIQNFILYEEQNFIELESKNKYGLIDFNGKILIPIIYSSVASLKNGNFILGSELGYGIYRKGDLKKLNLQLFSSYSLQNNTIIGFQNNDNYFYTEEGKLLNKIDGKIELIQIREDGLYFFKSKNLYGIVNSKGQIIKKPFLQDKEIESENYDYFKGKINGKWLFFDYKGNELKSPNSRPKIDGE